MTLGETLLTSGEGRQALYIRILLQQFPADDEPADF